MTEPHTDPPEPSSDQISDDLAALSDLIAAGVEVDGEAQITESTWVIYGHTSYDGETIVGEYHDAAEASAVLRAVPRHDPDRDLDPNHDADHDQPAG